MMAEYSVIIPTCGRPRLLEDALGSVRAQTLKANRIIVVIDEVQHDPLYSTILSGHEDVEVVYTGGRKGAAAARNLGLGLVSTEFIFFLDDDDLWLPEKAQRQVALLTARPDCVGVTCWWEVEDAGRIRTKRPSESLVNRHIRCSNYVGSFSFFGMRRNQQTKGLRLDEQLPAAQDWDFYMNIARYGRVGVVPEVLARYRVHDADQISDDRTMKLWAVQYTNQKHWDDRSVRERMWNHGKLLVYRSALEEDTGSASLNVMFGALLIAFSWLDWKAGAKILWRSWRVRRMRSEARAR